MEMMKPILFNTEMVRAILDGRKTVTRRVIKAGAHKILRGGTYPGAVDWSLKVTAELDNHGMVVAPYQPGDILYVRETWSPLFPNHTSNVVVGYMYKADDFGVEEYDKRYPNGKDWEWLGEWKPSIHMPKEAARIFLRVTDVRAERLCDLSIDDIYREGVSIREGSKAFSELWDRTIKRADRARYGWDANPWVWVIEFERCEKPKGE